MRVVTAILIVWEAIIVQGRFAFAHTQRVQQVRFPLQQRDLLIGPPAMWSVFIYLFFTLNKVMVYIERYIHT